MPGGMHEHMRAWDPEEDRLILECMSDFGPRWSRIVKRLPGRTISSVRNRWQRIDKGRKQTELGATSKNRCQNCGEPKRGHVCFARMAAVRGVTVELGSSMFERPRALSRTASAAVSRSARNTTPPPSKSPQITLKPVAVQRGVSTRSDASLAAVLPSASDLDADSDDTDDSNDEPSSNCIESTDMQEDQGDPGDCGVPIISRMKSGGRICSELGFDAVEATAADPAAQREEPLQPSVILVTSRAASDRSVRSESDLLSPSRMPSLRSLAPPTAFLTAAV